MGGRTGGIVAVISACTIWGLSVIYYKVLAHVAPLDVLAHRTIWSAAMFGVIVLARGRGRELAEAMSDRRRVARLILAATMISGNWLCFIVSVQMGFIVESSLGYYIYPLVAVLFGLVFFGERPARAQQLSVALATAGVLVLAIGLGAAPWISLALALTFAIYGAVKRGVAARPLISVTAEVLCLSPVAIAWIAWRGGAGFWIDWPTTLLLLASGPLTAMPLIFFSMAAKRLSSATLGILFYVNPTLQFLCGVLLFSEPFTLWHRIAFPLIWGAVALYSISLWRLSRRPARKSSAAAESGTA